MALHMPSFARTSFRTDASLLKSKTSTIIEQPSSSTARTLSPVGCLIYFTMVVTFVAYATLRYHTSASTLSLVILVAEVLAALRTAVYGVYIVYATRMYTPPEDLLATHPCATFNVRVLVPCYNEALAIVQETVLAAAQAELPPGCSKFLYLCVELYSLPPRQVSHPGVTTARTLEKRHGWKHSCAAWCVLNTKFTDNNNNNHQVFGVPIRYIADRVHDPKRGNGKSQNLNNALQKHIYTKFLASPADIPPNEVVVTFDADMVPVPEFFMRTLPYLLDDQTAIVQTPQHFWNIDHDSTFCDDAPCGGTHHKKKTTHTTGDILENAAKMKWNIAYKGVPDQVREGR